MFLHADSEDSDQTGRMLLVEYIDRNNYRLTRYYTANLHIFAAISFSILPMDCHFAMINFRMYFACHISCNANKKFLQQFVFTKFMPCEYRRNKSLGKVGLQYVRLTE